MNKLIQAVSDYLNALDVYNACAFKEETAEEELAWLEMKEMDLRVALDEARGR